MEEELEAHVLSSSPDKEIGRRDGQIYNQPKFFLRNDIPASLALDSLD